MPRTPKPYSEADAIRKLENLAKRWPKSLWLYAVSDRLEVMKKMEDGQRLMNENGGVDDAASVASIDIEADGGDW